MNVAPTYSASLVITGALMIDAWVSNDHSIFPVFASSMVILPLGEVV